MGDRWEITWNPNDGPFVVVGTKRFNVPLIAGVLELIDDHNADCDAYEKQIAELRRRLDLICECAENNKRNRRFIAIAEGRTE